MVSESIGFTVFFIGQLLSLFTLMIGCVVRHLALLLVGFALNQIKDTTGTSGSGKTWFRHRSAIQRVFNAGTM